MRYVIFLLLFPSLLIASTGFTAHLKISNTHPVVKEAVILELHISLKNTKKFYRFHFEPPSTSEYQTLFLESTKVKKTNGQEEVVFHVALFPRHEGRINPKLTFTAEETTQAEVKKFVTGSADELTDLHTKKEVISLPPVTLTVVPLEKGTRLIGDFTLTQQIDKTTANPNEQINILYTLSGRGYPPQIDEILNTEKIPLYTAHETFRDKLYTKKIFRYALITDQNLTLPAIKLKAYNPKQKRYYTLQIEPVSINIRQIQEKNKGVSLFNNRALIENALNIVIFTFTGILLGLLLPLKQNQSQYNPFRRIKKSATFQELLHETIILSKSHKELEKYQHILEEYLYTTTSTKKTLSLRKIKNEIIRQLKT